MTETIFKVENLNKYYDRFNVLHDINFEMKKGEVLTIIGPSGSGKSTLIRCLNGLETYTGKILFNGTEVKQNPSDLQVIRQKIGMVFQSYDLFPNLTVLENIMLAPIKVQKRNAKDVEKNAKELLKRVGLLDELNAYPRQLSGGQKQRIAIIRALAMHPEIMLFDEITASLDPEMVRGVLEIVKELSKKDHMTMVIVTHEMNFASQIADQVIFLEKGRILENTTGEKFFKAPKTKRAAEFLQSMDF